MSTTTTERGRSSTTSVDEDTDTRTRPDLWDVPGSGIAWCDCGENHGLARRDVADLYHAARCRPGKRVPHRTVVRVTREVWQYAWVCRFFHLKIEDAAIAVAGSVLPSYRLDDAIDITGLFTQTWQGCPEAACAAVW